MSSPLPELAPDPAYTAGVPRRPRPIVVIGAGGIVRDAHLPAYRKAGFTVVGIVDRVVERARSLADEFAIPRVHADVAAAVADAPADAVYDVAVWPDQYVATLQELPDGAAVLIQKPLGNDLAASRAVLELCRSKNFVAASNTQLRFAPYVAAARRAIAQGEIGELIDLEIRVTVDTPWHLFPHVRTLPRLEINAHSVHYIDLVRSFVGDPAGVSATSVHRPGADVANTRTAIILHYPDRPLRVVIGTDHDHVFGPLHQESFIKWEGTRGAIRAQMGLLLDYPAGREDRLQIASRDGGGWRDLPFQGSWFPDAFIGSMAALQNVLVGESATLPTSVEDAFSTMQVVEAAYGGAASRGTEVRGGQAPGSLGTR